MQHNPPPTLETFSHWPSWLNAYGNLDRSACFELRVSQVRRLAGCIPMRTGPTGKRYHDKGKRPADVPNLPNERRAIGHKRLISKGHYDISTWELDWLARQQFPRRLAGDWRTGRAPAMRSVVRPKPPGQARADKGCKGCQGCKRRGSCGLLSQQSSSDAGSSEKGLAEGHSDPPGRGPAAAYGMTLKQGGHGPGERAFERKLNCWVPPKLIQENDGSHAGPLPGGEGARQADEATGESTRQHPPPAPPSREGSLRQGPAPDAASREGDFKLPSPKSMVPGLPMSDLDAGLDGNPNRGATREKRFGLNLDWTQRLQMEKHQHASVSGVQYFLVCPGPTAPTPGAGGFVASPFEPDWVKEIKSLKGCRAGKSPCNRTAYKLFWVLARPGEHRDALLAEQWIASLSSGELSRQSAAVSALIDRYGPIMGDDRKLRCRACLNMRYAKSPEISRKNNERRRKARRDERAVEASASMPASSPVS